MRVSYYNERRTVEAMVFPFAFIAVVKDGVPDEYTKTRDELVQLFEDAAREVMPSALTQKQTARLYNRIKEVILTCITSPARHYEYPAAKAALVLYYFLRNMIDQGLYHISEGSKLEQALEMFLPAVQPWVEEVRFDKSAFKESRRMLTRMHDAGYFMDVEWKAEF